MQQESGLSNSCGSYCVDYENEIEPEGSLPPSQEPAICPYPEPDQSSSFHSYPISLPEGLS